MGVGGEEHSDSRYRGTARQSTGRAAQRSFSTTFGEMNKAPAMAAFDRP
jgi:hypothetical protein